MRGAVGPHLPVFARRRGGGETLARQLIDAELPKVPHFRERVKLGLIAWDDPAARIPMLATQTPQESVNDALPRPADCDVVIVILWSRMGTPLPDSLRKPNGEPYLSGTEWEYEDAVNSSGSRARRRSSTGGQRSRRSACAIRRKKDKEEQFERVEAFFAQLPQCQRLADGGINEYAAPSDFKALLRQHLEELLHRRLQSSADDHRASTDRRRSD